MFIEKIKKNWFSFVKTTFSGIGIVWLLIESYMAFPENRVKFSYIFFFIIAIIVGIVLSIVDGYRISGYLRNKICIVHNNNTKIFVEYGDLFKNDGWKAIGVNDFFDSKVDDRHISSKSLHGIMLKHFWGGNVSDWDFQVDKELETEQFSEEKRDTGKHKRYMIGTTAEVKNEGEKFLCVALAKTDVNNLETKADIVNLNQAVRGLLCKARSICADTPLYIPLMGSRLARVGIKDNILIDHILTAIFEESQSKRITSEIHIVLSGNITNEINLTTIKQDWS